MESKGKTSGKLRGKRLAAAIFAAAALAEPPPPDPPANPDRAHAQLEDRTRTFRDGLARAHAAIRAESLRVYRSAVRLVDTRTELLPSSPARHDHQAITSELARPTRALEARRAVSKGAASPTLIASVARGRAAWHLGRANGQRTRFANVRACGTHTLTPSCRRCGDDSKPIVAACGVRRVCPRCDVANAAKRRARFGRARGRAFVDGHRYGLGRKVRRGGAYSEKMLTLTIPHATLTSCTGEVRATSRDDVDARIRALHLAWPRFNRRLNQWWRAHWQHHVSHHRAFEWTPGADSAGHPHFHVYLFCPFVDKELLRAWWAESLRAVGWPVASTDDGRAKVQLKFRRLRSFDLRAVRELIKGGGRKGALTLSRIDFADAPDPDDDTMSRGVQRRRGGPGLDAYDYAEGWTLSDVALSVSPECLARLYMALEGRRLSQASAGFFGDDPRPECACCGHDRFWIRIEPIAEPLPPSPTTTPTERGPPPCPES